MNSFFENEKYKPIEKPKHMTCEWCNPNWLGYLIHEDTCPIMTRVFN